jgi:hypothetical protein
MTKVLVGLAIVLAPGLASAQPAPVYQPPEPTPTPAPTPTPSRSKWYLNIGIGMGGYVATEDGNEGGGGAALEGQVGGWLRPDLGLGARLEAHSDDPEMYTNSSFTVVARIPVGGGRTYLEPGFGLAFHRIENMEGSEPTGGLAVAITVGRQMAKRRFAFDIRGGLAHQRFDRGEFDASPSHGLIWFGIAAGLQ